MTEPEGEHRNSYSKTDKDATFMSDPNSTISMIWVYENDELCGLVMPVRVPEEEF